MTLTTPNKLNSELQIGWVRHRRFEPKPHSLKYPMYMLYLDLDEIDQVNNLSRLISVERFNWLSFRRADFFGDVNVSLKTAVIEKICQHSSIKESEIKRVTVLTNLRTLGFLMNPVSFYYAFNKHDELLAIMPEITNTPWDERYQYVLVTKADETIGYLPESTIGRKHRFKLLKDFHVSPFNPMNMNYDWRYSNPTDATNAIHLENWQQNDKIFDATMVLTKQALTPASIRQTLIRFPWMTVKIAVGIYINAVKLWVKGVPFHSHPDKNKKEKTT